MCARTFAVGVEIVVVATRNPRGDQHDVPKAAIAEGSKGKQREAQLIDSHGVWYVAKIISSTSTRSGTGTGTGFSRRIRMRLVTHLSLHLLPNG